MKNNGKMKKKIFDNNSNIWIEENNNDKNIVVPKDIITNSNNDINEENIKTNEPLKSKLENSDFIKVQDKIVRIIIIKIIWIK